MKGIADIYKVKNLSALNTGDFYISKNTLYVVTHKSFDTLTVFNCGKNTNEMIYTPVSLDVVMIKRGTLYV